MRKKLLCCPSILRLCLQHLCNKRFSGFTEKRIDKIYLSIDFMGDVFVVIGVEGVLTIKKKKGHNSQTPYVDFV